MQKQLVGITQHEDNDKQSKRMGNKSKLWELKELAQILRKVYETYKPMAK